MVFIDCKIRRAALSYPTMGNRNKTGSNIAKSVRVVREVPYAVMQESRALKNKGKLQTTERRILRVASRKNERWRK